MRRLCCKTSLFKIFWSFFAKKMTKRRERFRSTVALPVLFVISVDASRHALGRDELFFSARNRTGPAFVLQNEPFQDFVVIFFAKK